MKVLLGKNVIDKPIHWDIEAEKNPHLIVLGTSGSGKTETLKSVVGEFNQKKVPSLIIDFHNEYSDIATNVLDLRKKTINPLEFNENQKPENIIYEVADIIKKIFKLGEIQESILRQAIRQSYQEYGIDLKKKARYKEFPTFQDVEKNIYRQEDSSNKSVINSLTSRIEALFDIDIFSGGTNIEYKDMFKDTTVVELKDFPTEKVKSTIAEFFLKKLSYYIYSLERNKKIRMYTIIDEAHRLMYENSPLDKLLRESRKYGIGVILASQRPSDFNETVLANTGVLLSFQCNLDKDAKFVSKQFNLEPRKIKNLTEPGLGYIKFSRTERADRIKIIPIDERELEETGKKKGEGSKKKSGKKVEEEMEVVDEEPEEDFEEEPKEEETDEESGEKLQNLRRIFFYDNEKFSVVPILRTILISLLLLTGFWSLYFELRLAVIFFVIAFIWTPLFTHNLEVDLHKEKLRFFNVFRLLLSGLLFFLFYFL